MKTEYASERDSKIKIYGMGLHDVLVPHSDNGEIFAITILRVSGGWIYTTFDKGTGLASSVFVKLNGEFNK
jgi:hypothetical protein